ncbi:hypothetical protein [Parafrankia discariae]|uniref:hypothetical protein n=1 Tax=Parafrankia discariae TaxID=365528 RepID=UPI000363F1C2|nr:hypothetical protein [Parafrankia discariae]
MPAWSGQPARLPAYPPLHPAAPWPPTHHLTPYPLPYPVRQTVRSAGLAVLLSFLWPGLGHLYVGRVGVGIALLCTELAMVVISLTVIGLIVAVPVGIIVLVAAAATAGPAAQDGPPPGRY